MKAFRTWISALNQNSRLIGTVPDVCREIFQPELLQPRPFLTKQFRPQFAAARDRVWATEPIVDCRFGVDAQQMKSRGQYVLGRNRSVENVPPSRVV
jgi:hypothetical protein